MAINVMNTADLVQGGVKILTYGASGAGKTTLIKTLPNPITLSAEGGLLSVKDAGLPYIQISDMDMLTEAYIWLMESQEAQQYESVALDSISEIAEVCLSTAKKKLNDGRAAYGEMQDQMGGIIRSFRDIANRHVYFTAKVEKSADELGNLLYYPSLPGVKFAQQLPYFFDEVLALRVEKDAEGNTQRGIQCDSDGIWLAKDRSGKLGQWEAPDISAIIKKIGGVL